MAKKEANVEQDNKVREKGKEKKGLLSRAFGVVTKATAFVLVEQLVEHGVETVVGKDIRWHFGENGKWGVSLEEYKSKVMKSDDPAYIASNDLNPIDENEMSAEVSSEKESTVYEDSHQTGVVDEYIVTEDSSVTYDEGDERGVSSEFVDSSAFVDVYSSDEQIDSEQYSQEESVQEESVQEESDSSNLTTDTPDIYVEKTMSPDEYEAYIHDMALKTYRGEFGNGQVRKDALGDEYSEIQHVVNEKYYGIDDGYDSRVAAAEGIIEHSSESADLTFEN